MKRSTRKKEPNSIILVSATVAAVLVAFVIGFVISRSGMAVNANGETGQEKYVADLRELGEETKGSEAALKPGTEESNNAEKKPVLSNEQDTPTESSVDSGKTDEMPSVPSTPSTTQTMPDTVSIPSSEPDYKAIANPIVMLDPGHGGFDNGCEAGGILEKDVNFAIALKIKALLENMGYQVAMTRETNDVKVYLDERVQASVDSKADVFVSIHQNLFSGDDPEYVTGIETYYGSGYAPVGSERLARLVHNNVITNTGARDRGVVVSSNLVVVTKVTCPSILIETGFLSSSSERALLTSEDYQNKIASGIADAIHAFFTE